MALERDISVTIGRGRGPRDPDRPVSGQAAPHPSPGSPLFGLLGAVVAPRAEAPEVFRIPEERGAAAMRGPVVRDQLRTVRHNPLAHATGEEVAFKDLHPQALPLGGAIPLTPWRHGAALSIPICEGRSQTLRSWSHTRPPGRRRTHTAHSAPRKWQRPQVDLTGGRNFGLW